MSRSKSITKRLLSVLSSAALAASCFAAAGGAIPAVTATALEAGQVANPVIWADVPDPDIIRVGDTYYMVSTTMFFTPGVPVMKSKDLVSWEICSYVYDTMADGAKQTLSNGQHDYAHGSWAASLRYNKGTFYVFFGSYGTNKSYIYKTNNIESGNWTKSEISGMYHDASILFDDDGRNYLVYGGGGEIKIKELNSQMTGFAYGAQERTIIKTGLSGLAGEGSHIQKINGYYYVFLIAWPNGSGRTELCYRSKSLTGSFEGKTVLNSGLGTYGSGVAQGGIVDTPSGKWYSIVFRDCGAVGRIPVLVPVTWENVTEDGNVYEAPVFGIDGKVPMELELSSTRPDHVYAPLYGSDDFKDNYFREFCLGSSTSFDRRLYGCFGLKSFWQFSHEPDLSLVDVDKEKGTLRISTDKICTNIHQAGNVLTQRMMSPGCIGEVTISGKGLKEGDMAGLAVYQGNYIWVGITRRQGKLYALTTSFTSKEDTWTLSKEPGEESELTLLDTDKLRVRLDTTFEVNGAKLELVHDVVETSEKETSKTDIVAGDRAECSIYINGEWKRIGPTHKLSFRLDYFTGARFGLFVYSTNQTGGTAQFSDFTLNRR